MLSTSLESQKTVIVIDDEPTIRTIIERLLTYYGFHTVPAADSAAVMTTALPHADAFIVDLHLKGGATGLDVVAWVRAQPQFQMTPVFILTGDRDIAPPGVLAIEQHRAEVFHKGESLRPLIERLQQRLAEPPTPGMT